MIPTDEQQAVLDSQARILRVNARAGTGKTTTLLMFARMNPDKKIIYLVYNKRAKDEAKGTFPRNVDVHTIHSLALNQAHI